MSPDDPELRRRLRSLSRDADPPAADPAAMPPAREARPVRPSRPAAPTPAPRPAPPAARPNMEPPQAPRLTGVAPRAQADASSGTTGVDVARTRWAQTALPPCLTLAVTLPLLAAGWFALDPYSLLRANAFGVGLPIALLATGTAFAGVSAALFAGRGRGSRSV